MDGSIGVDTDDWIFPECDAQVGAPRMGIRFSVSSSGAGGGYCGQPRAIYVAGPGARPWIYSRALDSLSLAVLLHVAQQPSVALTQKTRPPSLR